ncbi:HAD family hydrolase [Natronolimnobius baerhuensis]|uniref:Haloacid dehalogenase n=1 Tax=Natronolimnobius baerhuensis TaxID=253108 RepID=A0A202E8K4_9EURY|nr:HAD family hydrolase [Natronolimnobius baerhuensis]OVE84581.1 haloacid dehalogenase [Natronolimnobius baerhuensis]
MAAYDAICFDLDRTLCEPTQDPAALLETTFDRAGCDPFCSPADLRAAIPALPTAETDREFYENLFAEVTQRSETTIDAAQVPTLADAYLECTDPTAVEFRPGAAAALEYARERAQVALITNGGRKTQTQKLQTLDIADAFDVRVFTEPSAGIYPKPDAAPFEYALGELEATPDRALHIGDSVHADIAGANAMGLDSALVATDGGTDVTDGNGHRPTYELESLEAFESII